MFISTQSESGYADGVLQIVDAETHQLEYRSGDNLFGGYAWTGVHALKIANVDSDPNRKSWWPPIGCTTARCS